VFAPYSYDAFMVAMTTLNTLYEQELYDFNITELRAALRQSQYLGTTGVNSFDAFQDRQPVYDICNAKGDGKWTVIGSYKQNRTTRSACLLRARATALRAHRTAGVRGAPRRGAARHGQTGRS
jgi:hypothetical protein